MRFTASFLEYFVTGTLAIFWIYPLLPPDKTVNGLNSINGFKAVLVIPLVYSLGMVLDFVAVIVLDPLKKAIRKAQQNEKEPRISRTVAINAVSGDLGSELQIRATRDRIARGIVINSVILFIVLSFLHMCAYAAMTFLFIPVSVAMWWRFESLSRRFRHNSYKTLEDLGLLDRKEHVNSIQKQATQKIRSFLRRNWQFLWTATLIPVSGWLWNRNKK